MNIQDFVAATFGLSIAGVVTVSAGYYLLKQDIHQYLKLKSSESGGTAQAELLTLRLQAHERLILFVDRINPASLFLRLHQQGMSAALLHALILEEVRTEYQHNVTQQLYIGTATWQAVRKLKEDTLIMINHARHNLPDEALAAELYKMVLQHLGGMEHNPYDLSQELITKEIHLLF
ncbi:hypothetical protein DBR11_12340 [Pedobacter sp. HMWF019]|uniref:DUF7935 family protein n=1 Tax=Pedobacter sp. HMWF019 TaxID=2056856 RepID=UPI000D3D12AF|nr:hypothetical protein [Pedobacter sp. HMWF019]PTS99462.1 hypothetical protein DBR11_12340 [Pedobacter sp. HMWF019]